MTKPKLLAFDGSLRRDSFNRRLVQVAAEGARRAGAEVTLLSLRDHPMPIFDEDLEAASGLPPGARAFQAALAAHDGFLIASPEYNSSVTAALKNALDWASRAVPGQPALFAFRGRVASLMAASPGALGGLRGLVTLRSILGNIGVVVLPDQLAVGRAHEAFGADGRLKDERQHAAVEALGAAAADAAGRLRG
jgi:NAD(P)H-dependent FMN reductase